jgi:DNA-binding GntR family transcriptional regulator
MQHLLIRPRRPLHLAVTLKAHTMREERFAIIRDNISDAVVIELRNRIVDGRLPAGERINEVQLSQALGVSRTPLREALARLTQEGALRQVPRIGYFVRALTLEEFEQIYAIRPLLDPEALRLAGVPSRDRMARLHEINDRIWRERDTDAVIDLDNEWHLELVADCPNRVLVDLIQQFIQRTRRYELALKRERRQVEHSIADHERILSALHNGNLDAACAELKRSMRTGRRPIVEWLIQRERTRAQGKETT